jgi:hypothetical protein
MKNKRSARARTSPLLFAPLLLGTIAAPALRPIRVPVAERARGTAFSDDRIIRRTK